MKIIYHNDFDGMAAAGIFSDFLDFVKKGKNNIFFRSIDYDEINKYINEEIKEEAAVLDFPFHPDAKWWIDHHKTAFRTKNLKSLYKPSKCMYWNTRAKSCPALMRPFFKKYYPEYFSRFKLRYSELVKYSSIIDSAGYESPAQIYDFENCYFCFNYGLSTGLAANLTDNFIYSIRRGVMEEFFASTEFSDLKTTCECDFSKYENNKEVIIEYEKKIITLDYLSSGLKPQRYFGYLYYPDADYTIMLSQRNGMYYVGAGYNPWKSLNNVNLGELFIPFGGGGRMDVGAALLKSQDSYDKCVDYVREKLSNQVSA